MTRDAIRVIASRLRSTSVSLVAQEETLMRMAKRPFQSAPPHQHPSFWIACIVSLVMAGSPKETQHLIEYYIVQDFEASRS